MMKLAASLAFLLFAFAVVGYIDMLEEERLSIGGYVMANVCK